MSQSCGLSTNSGGIQEAKKGFKVGQYYKINCQSAQKPKWSI